MRTFEQDLKEATDYHGHLCSGQIIGVRMARLAAKMLGLDDPRACRDLVAYVECDRCLTDAIGTVTDCKLGKRNLKWLDYGKSAATFLNAATGEALRIYRETRLYPPEGEDLVAYFNNMKDAQMFRVESVKVDCRPEDLPGKPLDAVTCKLCGEEIIDGRQVPREGDALCKACAYGAYYQVLEVLPV